MSNAQKENGKSWRAGKNSGERGYGSRWQKARHYFLLKHSLCVYCEKQGRTTAATVVDHIKPHKGDMELFWDSSNWQPLCKMCHDSIKAREEVRGEALVVFGVDGYPINGDE